MRNLLVFSLLGLLLVTSSGCTAKPTVVEMMADYPYVDGVGDAVRQSDAVVVVRFIDARSELIMPDMTGDDPETNPQAGVELSTMDPQDVLALGVPATFSRVRVVETHKGAVSVGSVITVQQDGGEIDGVQYKIAGTSLLSDTDFPQYALILTATSNGFRLTDPFVGIFGGTDSESIRLLNPAQTPRAADRNISSVEEIVAAGHT